MPGKKTYEKKSTCMDDKPKGLVCYKVKKGYRRRRTK